MVRRASSISQKRSPKATRGRTSGGGERNCNHGLHMVTTCLIGRAHHQKTPEVLSLTRTIDLMRPQTSATQTQVKKIGAMFIVGVINFDCQVSWSRFIVVSKSKDLMVFPNLGYIPLLPYETKYCWP